MNKRHRVFVAINLPNEVKRALGGYETKLNDLPAKWTKQNNLHITLIFLGDVTDQELGEVCMVAKEVVKNHQPIDIAITKTGYGPDEKIPPKMVWASGEKSNELSALKNDLENALLDKVSFIPEHRGFTPHITLARVNAMEWRAINPEERPEVNEVLDLVFTAESIEVMESEMKKGGPEYTIIESFQLGE